VWTGRPVELGDDEKMDARKPCCLAGLVGGDLGAAVLPTVAVTGAGGWFVVAARAGDIGRFRSRD